ncbi:MAG TPA: hypothetical protein VLC09_05135 [Polyangiaceae bacterium]|nr:hypothetical protein [Polyangiaceae bacterium]
MNRAPLSPTSALVAHAESLLTGGRVLVVGNAESCLAEHLLERGARLVQVLDPDPRRVAQAAAHNAERRVTYAPLLDSSFRDSAFDCAVVEDLATAAQPAELLAGIRRAIGAQGVALVSCSSDEQSSGLLGARRGSLRFARFSEAVHGVFERVLLVAQTPFVGYAVVHLDLEGPPEPALDNGYLTGGADDADFYIAIAGRSEAVEALELEDMTIVQLPAQPSLSDGHKAQRANEARLSRRIETLELELRSVQAQSGADEAEQLRAELSRRDAWIKQLEARAESADERADQAEAELERLEDERASITGEELERLRERLDDAERVAERHRKESTWADERVKKLERELEAAQAEANRGPSEELRELERGLASERSRCESLVAQLDSERREKQDVERKSGELSSQLAEREGRIHHLENQLREGDSRLRGLEERAAEQAQRAAEQARRLAEAAAAPKTDHELSRLEAQLAERGEAVRELESQLAQLEGYAKTLVAELGARVEPSPTALQRELRILSRSLAEREADLVAASWKIGSLERRLVEEA